MQSIKSVFGLSRVFIIISAIVFAVAFSGDIADAQSDYTVRIHAGFPGWDHSFPFIADEFGIWEAYDLDVDFEWGSSARVTQVLQTNDWDAAYTQVATAITFRDRGIPLVIAGATTYGSAVVVSRNDLPSPQDIRRFGIVNKFDTMHLLAEEQILPNHGVDVSQVEFIPVPPPESGLALFRGEIDAYYLYEPYATEVVQAGQAKLLWDWRDVFNNGEIYRNSLVLNENFVRRQPELARKVVWAHMAAMDFIRMHPDEAVEVITRLSDGDATLVAAAWHRAGWDHYQVPEYWLELTVDQLLRAGILDRPVDPEVLTRYDLQEGYTPPAIP